ncbi:Tn3 family transposase [Streptomyces sp. NPDC093591]|uniref:Tn3 family transposase n=1 Tax=Streptomyces sp. NPDC093591 TaxID=3366044 RepID=UPI003826037E
MIGEQLSITEARHRLARRIFFGRRGELRRHYRQDMEKPAPFPPRAGRPPTAAPAVGR